MTEKNPKVVECTCGAKFIYKFGWKYICEDEQMLIDYSEDACQCCRETIYREQRK